MSIFEPLDVPVGGRSDLDEAVKKAEKELESVTIADEVSDEVCDQCGRHMVIKYGPHGKFLACPGFPECKNTKPYFEKTGIPCPKCGKEVVIKKTKKGRKYYGCENNPDCDFTIADCKNADISVRGIANAIRLRNLSGCRVLLGPCKGSVFIQDCINCEFQVACHSN